MLTSGKIWAAPRWLSGTSWTLYRLCAFSASKGAPEPNGDTEIVAVGDWCWRVTVQFLEEADAPVVVPGQVGCDDHRGALRDLGRLARLPRCAHCETVVHYELMHPAPDGESDPDFRSRRIFEIAHPEIEDQERNARKKQKS